MEDSVEAPPMAFAAALMPTIPATDVSNFFNADLRSVFI
jgi:hypothetical protein